MKWIYIRIRLPVEFEYFLRRILKGKYYAKYIQFNQDKDTGIPTHELGIQFNEPYKLKFGISLNFKELTFGIDFLWLRLFVNRYEDLPF